MEKVSWRRREDRGDNASLKKRIKRGGGEVIEIPNDDTLEEIMVRLPVKTLVRFQIVSKHWRGMITSSSFREKYLLHQKTQEPKFVCIYEDEDWNCHNLAAKTMSRMECSTCLAEEEECHITMDDKEEKLVVISDSLDGLVCLYGFTDLTRPIKVINPATRWSHTLPLAQIQRSHKKKKLFPSPGFGKDYVTGAYKLVWLHNINDDNTATCEVFDFGVKQWRQVSPPCPDHHRIDQYREPIFANGWLYWFCQDKTKLVAFDLHMDTFRVIPNPSPPSSSVVEMHMGSIDDDRRLMWISEINKDGMQHVWRLTNHNTGGALLKMGKMFSFELNKIFWIEPFPHPSSHLRLEALSKKGNKAMLSIPSSQFFYLFQHPTNLTSISYSPPRPTHSLIRSYFPSFASPL
ncbi:putative F-box protein [Raphanus sativus]|uniref:F-box protein At2g02030 n=1 Tax=Raphanus sativus TaxID=3726 RepID=A0A6J0KJT4_RAPSA|nr:putative F-box protein At2g02030 [Raphanus sativus]KAJ4879170.1 putative F-box protein [Raphanus sativus]